MNLTLEKRAVLIKNLIEERWKIGDLYYKLKDHQIDLYSRRKNQRLKREWLLNLKAIEALSEREND